MGSCADIVFQDGGNTRVGGCQAWIEDKRMFTSSPAYACMPPALQFVYAVLVLMAESSGMRILMAAPNGEWEPKNKRPLRSELAASWADISHPERLLPARRQFDSAG